MIIYNWWNVCFFKWIYVQHYVLQYTESSISSHEPERVARNTGITKWVGMCLSGPKPSWQSVKNQIKLSSNVLGWCHAYRNALLKFDIDVSRTPSGSGFPNEPHLNATLARTHPVCKCNLHLPDTSPGPVSLSRTIRHFVTQKVNLPASFHSPRPDDVHRWSATVRTVLRC